MNQRELAMSSLGGSPNFTQKSTSVPIPQPSPRPRRLEHEGTRAGHRRSPPTGSPGLSRWGIQKDRLSGVGGELRAGPRSCPLSARAHDRDLAGSRENAEREQRMAEAAACIRQRLPMAGRLRDLLGESVTRGGGPPVHPEPTRTSSTPVISGRASGTVSPSSCCLRRELPLGLNAHR